MTENNHNKVCDVCGSGDGRCGMCGNMCGFSGRHILRWILGIIIITWVFCIGMKMGELKAYLEQSGSGYGHRYMMYRNSPVPMPMMGGATWGSAGGDEVYFSQVVPASVTVSSGAVKAVRQ